MTLKEFLKFTPVEQGTYIGAAVSMLAHTHAANGNVTKARCIQKWYFGDRRERAEPPGAREVSIGIDVAANLGSERYHVEGVIMGAADKACGPDAPRPAPKP